MSCILYCLWGELHLEQRLYSLLHLGQSTEENVCIIIIIHVFHLIFVEQMCPYPGAQVIVEKFSMI